MKNYIKYFIFLIIGYIIYKLQINNGFSISSQFFKKEFTLPDNFNKMNLNIEGVIDSILPIVTLTTNTVPTGPIPFAEINMDIPRGLPLGSSFGDRSLAARREFIRIPDSPTDLNRIYPLVNGMFVFITDINPTANPIEFRRAIEEALFEYQRQMRQLLLQACTDPDFGGEEVD